MTAPAQLLIDGKLAAASGGATYPIVTPATEEVIGAAPAATAGDVGAAVAAARRAFDETAWSTDVGFRIECLRQLHRALVDHGPAMRALTTAEAGAPARLTTGPQYDLPVESLAWVTDLAAGYEWERELGPAAPMGIPTTRHVHREAVGVVAAITPWNFPNQINLAKIGPALAAGNTVVLKPAPDTPWIAAELGRLAAEHTDLPAGVFNVITSPEHVAGAMLTSDPRVDLVSFTGSTATGRAVMASAAGTLKRVFLELGGKSAAVVLDDGDLGAGAGLAAYSVCVHAGQGCALTTRLIVPRARYDEAVAVAARTMQHIKVGDPTDPATVCGPLINSVQRDRVEGYLALARAEGGRFAVGGTRPDFDRGFWAAPTVVAGLDNDARTSREEIFGPVLVVLAHDGDDDAVRIANDSPYGLSGAVTSADPERARAVAKRIRTGTLSVNGGVWFAPDAPFGGYKQSGLGREMGVAGLEEYLETKLIAEAAR
ncbi:MAG: aldehyde dehydrogenase [Jatrophihabitans sp.]|uniref:aldehyde dehydrogenase n=1 Tax=Jatrophihabitans sp. TaxID=1932789 RepID=UPI0039110353